MYQINYCGCDQCMAVHRKEAEDNKGWTRVQCPAVGGRRMVIFWFRGSRQAEEACFRVANTGGFIADDRGHREEVDGSHHFSIESF